MEALKPLLVLGLLGTILYGAFLIMQKGPGNAGPAWQPPAGGELADYLAKKVVVLPPKPKERCRHGPKSQRRNPQKTTCAEAAHGIA
jgi:hypothetical protein